jgi:predicted CoA-binding protein
MSTKKDIHMFLAEKRIAFAGVSRNRSKFSNVIYRKLKETGHKVYPINPNATLVEDDLCYKDISSLPEPVTHLMIVASPYVAVQMLEDVKESSVEKIWIHTGPGQLAGLGTEIEQMKDVGKTVISGQCPMLHLEPVAFPHNIHRFCKRLIGTLPK